MSYLLREAGIRVNPSSTAVDRLWNMFGDGLPAKRRSMKGTNLAELGYTQHGTSGNLRLDYRRAPLAATSQWRGRHENRYD